MLDLDLVVNSIPISLNKSYLKIIETKKLKKVGYLLKKQMKLEKDESAYWVKNPSIKCFNSDFKLYPTIGISNINARQMFGTSAYFYFKNDLLIKVSFQLIQNQFFAEKGLQLFRSICGKIYGIPKVYGNVNDVNKFAEWEDDNSILITELSDCSKHFYVHWILK